MPWSKRKRPTASMSSWRASGTSMIGKPETVRRVDAEPIEALEHLVGLPPEVGADRVAALRR